MSQLRKFLSILLLAVFGLPAAAPLFALSQTPESRLPACCRRAGDHHCAGNMAQMEMGATQAAAQADHQPSPNPTFAPATPRCPYTPSILPTQHLNPQIAARLNTLEDRLEAQRFIPADLLAAQRPADKSSCSKRGPPPTAHS